MPYGGQSRLFEADQHSRDVGFHQPGRRPEDIPYLYTSLCQSLLGQVRVSWRSQFPGVPGNVGLQILLLRANQQLYLDDSLELLPANKRVTDGARTRALRSHNPPTYVSAYCVLTAALIRVDPVANSQRGRTNLPHLQA